jgi:beta-glucosidase
MIVKSSYWAFCRTQDPHLGMMMVQPAVQGIQSQGVIANAKHFVLNSQETNRTSVSAQVDERSRFEIYYRECWLRVTSGLHFRLRPLSRPPK